MKITPHEIIEAAAAMARRGHEGQFRRDGITPYITHPEAVAKSLEGSHPFVIAAAWLHDVLEDTHLKVVHLHNANIPWEVIDAVEALTKKRDQSYEDYLRQVLQNDIAVKVKIADIGHNLSDKPTTKQAEKYAKALLVLWPAGAESPSEEAANPDNGLLLGVVVAVDFDGTCVAHEFPAVGREIGAPRVLKRIVAAGGKLILWTMRSDGREGAKARNGKDMQSPDLLADAVNWFAKHDIPLHGIQRNPEQDEWTTSPKAYAQIYIDDAALGCPLKYAPYGYRPHVDWEAVEAMIFPYKGWDRNAAGMQQQLNVKHNDQK